MSISIFPCRPTPMTVDGELSHYPAPVFDFDTWADKITNYLTGETIPNPSHIEDAGLILSDMEADSVLAALDIRVSDMDSRKVRIDAFIAKCDACLENARLDTEISNALARDDDALSRRLNDGGRTKRISQMVQQLRRIAQKGRDAGGEAMLIG